MLNAEAVASKLESTAKRQHILARLNEQTEFSAVPAEQKYTEFVKDRLIVDHQTCVEIGKNTRAQSDCGEWYAQRRCRLTSSIFGSVMNRRKTIYPKSIINKVIKTSHTARNASCQWGTENEHTALLRYHEYKQKNDPVEICYACGLVVNPKWPWLGSSPDALISDAKEKNVYGAAEVKCPASKADISIMEACNDKLFCLELKNGKPSLKKAHVYFFQSQGVMAICQLSWLDFIVYTRSDLHVERIYFDELELKEKVLPQLTCFYFDYLMNIV